MNRYIVLLAIGFLISCNGTNEIKTDSQLSPLTPGDRVASALPRNDDPNVSSVSTGLLANDIGALGINIYQNAVSSSEGNVLLSPYSVYTALAMTYAGAAGTTADEMVNALPISLAEDELHSQLNALDLRLVSESDGDSKLEVLNQLWGQAGFSWKPGFLDKLAINYGAGLQSLDFQANAEQSRLEINQWVEDATNNRIVELLPENSLDSRTALVLTNTIFFQANWDKVFDPNITMDREFNLLDGSALQTESMYQSGSFKYYSGAGYQSVRIPYEGDQTSFLVILPDENTFTIFEESFNLSILDEAIANQQTTPIALTVPKFSFVADLDLAETLSTLGMPTAFTPAADFSQMSDVGLLSLDDVRHKAFIRVDEEGTEAAAATAVEVGVTSEPANVLPVALNRPFIFAIMDEQANLPLFLGRVIDPTQ